MKNNKPKKGFVLDMIKQLQVVHVRTRAIKQMNSYIIVKGVNGNDDPLEIAIVVSDTSILASELLDEFDAFNEFYGEIKGQDALLELRAKVRAIRNAADRPKIPVIKEDDKVVDYDMGECKSAIVDVAALAHNVEYDLDKIMLKYVEQIDEKS